MPYLVAADLPTTSAGARFRALLERPEASRPSAREVTLSATMTSAADP